MNATTSANPTEPATMLFSTESWPKMAPTLRCCTIFIGIGRAPYFSWITMRRASSKENWPVIRPLSEI